jgi:4-amino-4-deoxy-L-arabinose transferase-like glycosyltransferase
LTTESKNTSPAGLPVIVVSAWAVILIVAFLANRGSDVGQIGKLFENLGGGPLLGNGVFDSLFGAGIALLIAGAWLGVGHFAFSFLPLSESENQPYVLGLAVKMGVGAAIWSLIWFFLGVAGAYSRWVAIVALVVGQVLLIFGFQRARRAKAESQVTDKTAAFDKVILGLIVVPVVLSLIASLAPPTAKDTLLYHFAVPKAFIAQGSNAFIEGNIASYLALGTEMHSVWAMLLGGVARTAEAAAGATIWLFFPLLLGAVFDWAQEIGISRRWSLIAVLMVASVPTAYHVAASAYIDLALALYITLAVYALARWWRTLENGWLILIAVFLGAALSAKLTTIFVIAAFALVILLRGRKTKESAPDGLIKILAGGFAALVLAGLIASPWYLRTWQRTGSPVFPFYMSIWPGDAPGWDVERSNLFQAMNSQYGRVRNTPSDHVFAAWNVSIEAQPEDARHFDGVLGVAFLFGLPLIVLALRTSDLPIEVKIGLGVAAVVFLFWLFSSMQVRYLLPILPVLSIGIAASVERIAERRSSLYMAAKYSLTAAAICGFLTTVAWFLQKAPLRVVLGGASRDQYLTRNLDYYPYYQALNTTTAPDAKVWLINMRRDTYNLDRTVVSDYLFEDWTLRKMLWESRSVQELKAKAAAMGVTYMLARHDFLFDYDRSSLVDDAKPRAENEAKLKIAKDFILDKANTVHADDKFSLVKLF